MIFGFVSGLDTHPILSMVADKPSDWSVPIRIDSLEVSECAVVFLSIEEGMLVRKCEDNTSIEIEACRPAKIYLTPDLPDRPGYSVSKVKVTPIGERKYKVQYNRDKGWEPWQPNVRLY